MFADDIGVHVAGVNGEVFTQQIAETGGIQRCAGTDDTAGIEAGEGAGDAGHNVHRVGSHQKDSVKARFRHRSDDGAEHLGVPVQQIQTGLAGLLGYAGANDHDIGVGAVGIVSGVDFHMGSGESQTVIQVHGFAPGPLFVQVDEHQLITGILVQKGVGIAHAHHAGADQNDFAVVSCGNHVTFSFLTD